MKKNILFLLVFLFVSANAVFAQTKVSGVVLDKMNQPIPFANVVFKDSSEGIVANEDGLFYLESAKTYTILLISSVGFSEKEITLQK
ncbi:MAG TPA: carboxypeptidase-like regulatory domain-containing protein, partial [Flavobacterium sp.]|nr:carboxypeptidase-like regulatory domain-containing protein [Flavobacterium sp.]